MAHFYGFIQGNRGEVTRMGSKGSGFTAWTQSYDGRITAELNHVGATGFEERDEAIIRISHPGGYSSVMSLNIANLTNFVKVLGDPSNEQARDLRTKIEDLFGELNDAVEVATLGDKIVSGEA